MRSLLVSALLIIMFTFHLSGQTPEALAELWDKHHITTKQPSDVRHKDLLVYLEQLRKSGVKMAEAGRSVDGREIFQLEWGDGPIKVFLWSQMHGDEPTATSALIDMFSILQQHSGDEQIKRLKKAVSLRAVPMLNPDGAEIYIRRNAQGLDINRDALDLVSPEAQLLKRLRDEWSPEIGFNLHNQQERTTVGMTNRQAAISLLVVYGDEAKTDTPGQLRNRRLASKMAAALNKFIPGNIGRYDDEWTATAFGDNFSAWGTPTILIETGALHGRDERYLVKMNFIAIMTALLALSADAEVPGGTADYDNLPPNSSGRIADHVFRRANIIDRTTGESASADIAAYKERRRASMAAPVIIRRAGVDIGPIAGLDEYDASGFYVVSRFSTPRTGSFAELLFYRKDRKIDWSAADIEKKFKPDAVFSLGRWVTGDGVVPRIK